MKKIRPIILLATVAAIFLPRAGLAQQPTLRLDKSNFAVGEVIAVHFTAPATYPDKAWAGIIPSSVPHGDGTVNDQNDVAYEYLNKRTEGTLYLRAPQEGNWDVRLQDTVYSGKEVASVSFTVGGALATPPPPPPVTTAPPPPPTGTTPPPSAAGPPKLTEKTVTIEVPANKAWTATGVTLNSGDYVRIQASGVIEASKESDTRVFYHKVPPEGRDEFIFNEPYPLLRGLCLVGKIGERGLVLPVEKYVHILRGGDPYGSGELWLGINDDNVSDNSGTWNVKITIFGRTTTAAAPPPVTTAPPPVITPPPPPSTISADGLMLKPSKSIYAKFEDIPVAYSYSDAKSGDTITLARTESDDQTYYATRELRVASIKSGSKLIGGVPEGKYEVRYNTQDGSKKRVLARVAITVEQGLPATSAASVTPAAPDIEVFKKIPTTTETTSAPPTTARPPTTTTSPPSTGSIAFATPAIAHTSPTKAPPPPPPPLGPVTSPPSTAHTSPAQPPVGVNTPPSAKPPSQATQPVGDAWVCDGATITNGGGATTWNPNFKATESNFSFTSAGTNTMTWTVPPRTLRAGEEVALTMSSTENPSPYIGGHFNINCAPKSSGENGASSNPTWRANSPHSGTMTFAFTPSAVSSGAPQIQVSAGNAGADGGPSTYVLVTWKYRKAGAAK